MHRVSQPGVNRFSTHRIFSPDFIVASTNVATAARPLPNTLIVSTAMGSDGNRESISSVSSQSGAVMGPTCSPK